MKSLLRVVLGLSFGVWMLSPKSQPNTRVLLPEALHTRTTISAVPPGREPLLRYVTGSTIEVEQLLGEEDKQFHRPTHSQTVSGYGIEGTDLGNSFESGGRVYFLFGDTVGRLRRALDTIATTDADDPENGVRLDFLKSGSEYLTIQPPGISMGAFEVPVAGIVSRTKCMSLSQQTTPRIARRIIPHSRNSHHRPVSNLCGRSEKESDARAIVQNGTMGDLSVTWCKDLGLWLITYDSREPAPRGILFSYSQTPWDPGANH
jgi:hypothetical protein